MPSSASVDAATARLHASWTPALILIGTAAGGAFAADLLSDVAALVVRTVIGVGCVAALLLGARHHRAQPRVAWIVLALGIGVWVVGDLLWDTFDVMLPDSGSPWYTLPEVLYLATYPALVWAMVKLVAGRGATVGIERVVDSFVLALILLLVLRAFLVDPSYSGNTADDVFNALFPLGDAMLMAGVAWLVFTPRLRNAAAWLLASGTALLLVTDVLWDLQQRISSTALDWLLDPMYPLAYATIAAAALHPSAGQLARSADSNAPEHTSRLVLLSCALALVPVLAFAAERRDALVVVLTGALVLALGVRFAGLVRALAAAQRAADRSARRFESLVASVPVGILEADQDTRIIFSNKAIDKLIGTSAVGLTDEELLERYVDPRDHHAARRAIAAVVSGRSAAAQMRVRDAAGVERWIAWYGAPVQDGSGRFAGAFSSTIEITPLKVAERALAKQALHDPLTGLANRRMLHDRLSGALIRLNRQPGVVAVLFLDLDGFKAVNDTCGHDVGDDLLQVVADRLHSAVRAEDVVARFGGDEFVVVLEHVGNRAHAALVAGKIIQMLSAPVAVRGTEHAVRVGASVGIVLTGDAMSDPDALVRAADTAMFDAKRAGPGTYRFAPEAEAAAV
jgi:diguanylate cyclase (GGDEF)-like protein/PAS domain S-box-containing protein